MVEEGVLENPKVDSAFMMHVFTGMPIAAGKAVISNPGAFTAASDWFDVKIKGKGGHGSTPESSIDPLNIAAHLHIALQAINSRELSGLDKAVITVGKMGGGLTNNVIPDTAELSGTVRTFDPKVREFIQERITEISELTVKTFRGECEVKYTNGTASVINNEDSLNIAAEVFKDLLGEENVIYTKDYLPGGVMMGSEDFAYVSKEVPSVMVPFTMGDARDEKYKYPHHHPLTCFDESVLYLGVAAYAAYAAEWLKRNKE